MNTPTLNFDSPAVIDGPYRYSLTRQWAPHLPPLVIIGLNPSKAGSERGGRNDDPTSIRCLKRAMGNPRLGWLLMVNLHALIATYPDALKHHPDPVGPANDAWIMGAAAIPGAVVVAAWGANEFARPRALKVTAMLADAGVRLYCLGRTKDGSPRHPGRLAYSTPLEPYEAVDVATFARERSEAS